MTDFTPAPVSGEQFELVLPRPAGELRAIVTEVGAALRHLSLGGVTLTTGYGEDTIPPMSSGAILVPWPNRVRDGRWVHDGRTLQLDLSEPRHHNAIHGLLRSSPYRLVERDTASVTLAATVFPQRGYPFHLDTRIRYALESSGLRVTHRVRNVGAAEAPVAVGAHPYLEIGDVPSDELLVTVAATAHIEVDDRLNPTGVQAPVLGTEWDLRAGRRVGELELNDAWADVVLVDGVSTHSLTATDGRSVVLWADPAFNYVQVFITRIFPDGEDVRTAVAVEPMSAPADAFNSGHGLRWLEPGEEWSLSWGIRAEGFGEERA
ncbi:aldose 1-epimerase family protein [Microbacteriaceae bacterium VKM Ac-2855]|nr:aldose 1-epimerase family protein [Microbacteriaceae bacterium VKM Ac-2855]